MTGMDDSGLTAVSTCECGRTFLGWGDARAEVARIGWAQHDKDAADALGASSRRADARTPKTVRTRAQTLSELVEGIDPARVFFAALNRVRNRHTPKPAEPTGAEIREQRWMRHVAQAVELITIDNMSVSRAAAFLGLNPDTLTYQLRKRGYGHIIKSNSLRKDASCR